VQLAAARLRTNHANDALQVKRMLERRAFARDDKINIVRNFHLLKGLIMVRKAVAEDLPRIAEIHISGWRFAYKGIISDIELFKNRIVTRALKGLEKQFNEGLEIIVYEDDENKIIKGFIFHGFSKEIEKKNSYEVFALYLQPEFTKQGIGTLLLNEIQNIMKEKCINELIVWVLEKNNIGRSFYSKYGFIEDGESKVIEDWNEKEIRMALTIASSL
jgi:GNAT superfamily N-acetyltransferase